MVWSLKKDLGSVQVSVAATSSSSKVSGSQRTKSSFQEIKGSPVESVSSSPMRILNPDKYESALRDLKPKDESQDGGLALGSPQRCSDGEDEGRIDQSATARKENVPSGAYHRSESSEGRIDVQDRDFSHLSGGKARGQIVASPDITNNFPVNGALDNFGPDSRSPSKPLVSSQFAGEDRENGSHYNAKGSRPRNSGKSHSSRLKDKQRYESDLDMGKARNSNVVNEQHDLSTNGSAAAPALVQTSKPRQMRRVRTPEKSEDIICRMMNSQTWTTRLQNSIRDLVPEFDHNLVWNVLHGAIGWQDRHGRRIREK